MKNNRTVAALALGCLALAFAAAPAASQSAQAPADELHTAPWFADLRGMSHTNPRLNGHGGGFVAQALRNAADDGWEPVMYSYMCGGVTTTKQAMDHGGGLAAELVDCESDTTYEPVDLRVHGIESGGWYWVFRPVGDDVAAAAAPLIRMDVLAQAPRQVPLEPGLGGIQAERHNVAVDADGRGSGGATLFTDDANRLFDILPHPAAVLPRASCSGVFLDAAATDDDCGLGVPADWELMLADGDGDPLSGAIVRPALAGTDVPVTATLSIGTGHLVGTGCTPEATIELTGGMSGTTVLTLPGAVTVSGANPANPGECPAAALSFSWTVNVSADTTRCAASNADRGTPQTVRVTATNLTETTPDLADDLFQEFEVVCAASASASSAGRELVPDVGLQ
ncbi:MAG: hypothetical protein F4112_11615 [Holophagales bacterium]|nr:hypothetical protein [Holophagales bacterium]MYD23427.1 hypothetical protein [Holophagales bacterium]MYI33602.1 hypothetical protein [Holophagales bacterium]